MALKNNDKRLQSLGGACKVCLCKEIVSEFWEKMSSLYSKTVILQYETLLSQKRLNYQF